LSAALSIGRSQSLGDDIPLLIEAHLLIDDVGELYDKWLAMDFIERIRDQQKFDTEKDLSDQIEKDCKNTKAILAKQFQ
jgi:riboflavin kinase/FMN adenylyltransferase